MLNLQTTKVHVKQICVSLPISFAFNTSNIIIPCFLAFYLLSCVKTLVYPVHSKHLTILKTFDWAKEIFCLNWSTQKYMKYIKVMSPLLSEQIYCHYWEYRHLVVSLELHLDKWRHLNVIITYMQKNVNLLWAIKLWSQWEDWGIKDF